MNYAYDAGGWRDFYICVGSASAALAGLLFVGLTLRLNDVVRRPRFRASATGNLVTLFLLLGISILVLIPGQSSRLLGVELAVSGGAVLAYSTYGQLRAVRSVLFLVTGLGLVVNVGDVLVLIGGISLAVGRLGGLFWLPPAVLALLAFAVFGAWRLVLGLVENEARQHAARGGAD